MTRMKTRFRETPGLLERIASQAAARLILFCAKRQMARGDHHEWNHSLAALCAGNTTECGPRCTLHDLTPKQLQTLVAALTAGRLSTPAGDPLR